MEEYFIFFCPFISFRYVMDDVKLMNDIDFGSFEEEFKLNPTPIASNKGGVGGASVAGNNNNEPDGGRKGPSAPAPKPQLDTLMEHTRLKNMAICKRKLPNLPVSELVRAVNALDIQTLSMDTIEVLQRMVPLEAEVSFGALAVRPCVFLFPRSGFMHEYCVVCSLPVLDVPLLWVSWKKSYFLFERRFVGVCLSRWPLALFALALLLPNCFPDKFYCVTVPKQQRGFVAQKSAKLFRDLFEVFLVIQTVEQSDLPFPIIGEPLSRL